VHAGEEVEAEQVSLARNLPFNNCWDTLVSQRQSHLCLGSAVLLWEGGISGHPLFMEGMFCGAEGLMCTSKEPRGTSGDGAQRMGRITDFVGWVWSEELWGCLHRDPGPTCVFKCCRFN